MKLTIDSREPNRETIGLRDLVILLADKKGIEHETKALRHGDWIIEAEHISVGLSRKTITDCLNSLRERDALTKRLGWQNKLARELGELKEVVDETIFLLEGSYVITWDNKIATEGMWPSNWHWSSFANAILSFQRNGIIVERTPSWQKTAERIVDIMSYYEKKTHAMMIKRTENLQLNALIAMGMGAKTGELLLKHFLTLHNLANASKDDIMEVKGVGEKKAEYIRRAMGNKEG